MSLVRVLGLEKVRRASPMSGYYMPTIPTKGESIGKEYET